MSCKICGKNSCTESFHSIEEQEQKEMSTYPEEFKALEERIKELEKLLRADTCDWVEKNKRIKEIETKNTLQRNALTWIVEEASSDIYNQSEILKVAEQALNPVSKKG